MKKRLLISSISTLLMCVSVVCGATYALFTSESKVNVAVTSGTVSVLATAENLSLTSSLGQNLPQTDARLEGNNVILDKFVPGDKAEFDIVIENKSDINVNYQTIISLVDGFDLFEGLVVTLTEDSTSKVYNGMTAYSDWELLQPVAGDNKEIRKVHVSIELPEDRGNEYQGLTAKLSFAVKAVQGNANVTNNDEPNTNYIYTAADFRLFANSVNTGNNFNGKVVKLMDNIDLGGAMHDPIGHAGGKLPHFFGTFEGNEYTISNFKTERYGIDGSGLFGWSEGPIKNVTVANAEIKGSHYVGGIVGYQSGLVENCHVIDSTIIATPDNLSGSWDNGDKCGGISGYMNTASDVKLTGCSVKNTKVSAYRDFGGIVGGSRYEVSKNHVENVVLSYDNSGHTYSSAKGNVGPIVGRDLGTTLVDNTYENVHYETPVSNIDELKAAIAAGSEIISLADGEYTSTTKIQIPSNADITITGSKNAIFDGMLKVTSGKLTINGITIKNNTKVTDESTSQYAYSSIAVGNVGTVVCNDVHFVQSMADGTAISSWWSSGKGTTVEVNNCVFDSNGQRPLRGDCNFNVIGCTFNDPYRYALQLTAKASTVTEIEKATVNFKNNTINAGTSSSKNVVYGIQLEGETYGNGNLIINGSGNVLDFGTTGKTGTMYYCECGKVDHSSITFNVTDSTPVHAN